MLGDFSESTTCAGPLSSMASRYKHGYSPAGKRTPEYICWRNIINRCTNPNRRDYARYGGSGILVCKRWMKFKNFIIDMGDMPTKEHQIDRIKNSKGYSPSNCRWSTRKDQGRNKTNNLRILYRGKNLPVCQWAEITGLNPITIRQRIKYYGWSAKETLTTPPRFCKRWHQKND